jgi:hypothetical protein
MYSPRNKKENLTKVTLSFLFLKLVLVNFIFADGIRILSLYGYLGLSKGNSLASKLYLLYINDLLDDDIDVSTMTFM